MHEPLGLTVTTIAGHLTIGLSRAVPRLSMPKFLCIQSHLSIARNLAVVSAFPCARRPGRPAYLLECAPLPAKRYRVVGRRSAWHRRVAAQSDRKSGCRSAAAGRRGRREAFGIWLNVADRAFRRRLTDAIWCRFARTNARSAAASDPRAERRTSVRRRITVPGALGGQRFRNRPEPAQRWRSIARSE